MRNLKKILSLLLAVMMVATAGVMINAEDAADYSEAATVLQAADVLKGYDDGELHLGDAIQRYQMALLIGRIMTGVTEDTDWDVGADGQQSPFTDLDGIAKYNGAIDFCYLEKIINGTSETEFSPFAGIKYDEAIAMICRAMGFTDRVYPFDYRNIANQIGLLEGIKDVAWQDQINRGVVSQLLYNMIKLVSGWNADEYEYTGKYFTAFDSFEITAEVKDAKIIAYFSLEGEVVYEAECPVVEADEAEKYLDYAGEEATAIDNAETTITYFELPGGDVWALVDTGVYQVGEGVIAYENAEDKALDKVIGYYTGINADKNVISVDIDDGATDAEYSIVNGVKLATSEEIDLTALTAETLYTFYVYGEGDEAFIIDAVAAAITEDLVVLKQVLPEEREDGTLTGNIIATVYALSSGFVKEEEIVVRSIENDELDLAYTWEEDVFESDKKGYDEFMKAYTKLSGYLKTSAWICNAKIDELGNYDLSVAPTYYGYLTCINDYKEGNAKFDIGTWKWDADGAKIVKVDGQPRYEAEAFIDMTKVHKNDYAEGKVITLDKDLTYVVVNTILGTVNVFKGQPTEGDYLEGNFIYDTVYKDGYVIVTTGTYLDKDGKVAGYRDDWTHYAPAEYVQVGEDGLWGIPYRYKVTSVEVAGYTVPFYMWNYTVKGLVDVTTGEEKEVKFTGLSEASYYLLKDELEAWDAFLVPEYIYKFFTTSQSILEKYVPTMYFAKTTYADMWEDLDTYEAVLEFVPGYLLRENMSGKSLYQAFDDDKYGVYYDSFKHRVRDVKLLSFIDDEEIDTGYAYDIGLNFDEETGHLYVKYLKRGVLVAPGKYWKDLDADGVKDGNEWFDYDLVVNMPGYWNDEYDIPDYYDPAYTDYIEVDDDVYVEGAYVEFGTTLAAYEIPYDVGTIASGNGTTHNEPFFNLVESDDAYVFVGAYGDTQPIKLTGGVATVEWLAKTEKRDMAPNTGTSYLGDAQKFSADADNEFTTLVELWKYDHAVTDLMIEGHMGIDENLSEYIFWGDHDDLKVSYQRFSLTKVPEYVVGSGVLGEEFYADFDEEIVELEKWDMLNVAQWVLAEATPVDALERSTIHIQAGELSAIWYAYGTYNEVTNVFEEYTKAEYEADVNLVGKDGYKGIGMWTLNLDADYVNLILSEADTAADDVTWDSTKRLWKTIDGAPIDIQILFIDAAYVDDKGVHVIDYDENFQNVNMRSDVEGWLVATIDGGVSGINEVAEVAHVCGKAARDFFKPVLVEDGKGIASRVAKIVDTHEREFHEWFIGMIIMGDEEFDPEDIPALQEAGQLYRAFINAIISLYGNVSEGGWIPGSMDDWADKMFEAGYEVYEWLFK